MFGNYGDKQNYGITVFRNLGINYAEANKQ
jgi:hypothetical protein